MQIILLTHSRELEKTTGTGSLVQQTLAESCQIIEWSRVHQPDCFEHQVTVDNSLLIYPENKQDATRLQTLETTTPAVLSQYQYFIILDGTWQQARKMYNRSPYLQALDHFALSPTTPSVYRLRRNQKQIGLCTAEVVIHLLTLLGHKDQAQQLNMAFQAFNQA